MDLKPSHGYISSLPPNQKERSSWKSEVRKRTIEVSSTSTINLAPDRARVDLIVFCRQPKETASDAKNSVARRTDYIIQTLHSHNVTEGDVTTTNCLSRTEGLFSMETHISVIFVDFIKCQSVRNFLVEKLDENVHVSLPHFYHSQNSVENLRKQATLQATRGTQQKAAEIARFVKQALGPPITIREEESEEWEGPASSQDSSAENSGPLTFQQRLANATIHVRTKVFASFELVERDKKKEPNS